MVAVIALVNVVKLKELRFKIKLLLALLYFWFFSLTAPTKSQLWLRKQFKNVVIKKTSVTFMFFLLLHFWLVFVLYQPFISGFHWNLDMWSRLFLCFIGFLVRCIELSIELFCLFLSEGIHHNFTCVSKLLDQDALKSLADLVLHPVQLTKFVIGFTDSPIGSLVLFLELIEFGPFFLEDVIQTVEFWRCQKALVDDITQHECFKVLLLLHFQVEGVPIVLEAVANDVEGGLVTIKFEAQAVYEISSVSNYFLPIGLVLETL